MNMHMSHEEELLLATVRGFLEDECFPHEDMVDQRGEVPEDLGRQIEARSKELGLFAHLLWQVAG
ncbi:MAG: acyl-CoA dehydrogenase family protein, partial [Pseudomonadota bacterium]